MAISVPECGRFRVNVFQQRGEVGLVIRAIRSDILDLARRGHFDAVRDKITTQGRPAYGAIKQALTELEAGDVAKRSGRRLLSSQSGTTG